MDIWCLNTTRKQASSGKEENEAAILCSLDSQLMKHVGEDCGDPE